MQIYKRDLNEESKNIINDYFQKSKSHLISKKDFARAIRLFTTLVLFLEEDKENKIKNNHNNVVIYLKASDLWNKDIYEDQDFNKNINELILINAPINQIISLYEYLGKDIENDYFEDIIQHEEEVDSFSENENDEDEEEDPFAEKDNEDEDDGGRDA